MPPIQRNDEKSSRKAAVNPIRTRCRRAPRRSQRRFLTRRRPSGTERQFAGASSKASWRIGRRRIRGGRTGKRWIPETSAASDARSYRSLVKTTKFRCHQFWVRVRQPCQRAAYAVPMLGLASGRSESTCAGTLLTFFGPWARVLKNSGAPCRNIA